MLAYLLSAYVAFMVITEILGCNDTAYFSAIFEAAAYVAGILAIAGFILIAVRDFVEHICTQHGPYPILINLRDAIGFLLLAHNISSNTIFRTNFRAQLSVDGQPIIIATPLPASKPAPVPVSKPSFTPAPTTRTAPAPKATAPKANPTPAPAATANPITPNRRATCEDCDDESSPASPTSTQPTPAAPRVDSQLEIARILKDVVQRIGTLEKAQKELSVTFVQGMQAMANAIQQDGRVKTELAEQTAAGKHKSGLLKEQDALLHEQFAKLQAAVQRNEELERENERLEKQA